ncbi:Uncharacterised protein [Vibrio cholerae]|nr:Uncharacterised protein [Vibrio cholerae]
MLEGNLINTTAELMILTTRKFIGIAMPSVYI